MRQSAVATIIRLFRLTAHTPTLFTIARKTWSLLFVCAAMMAAPHMDLQYQPTPRSAAACTDTLKSHRTELFIFLTIIVVAQAPSSFRKTMA
jgi:hypothetical protein